MNKSDNKGLFFGIALIVLFALFVSSIDFSKDKIIINSKSMDKIKSSFVETNASSDFIQIHNIEGSKRYVLLTFKAFEDVDVQKYVLYDTKKGMMLSDIDYEGGVLNITNASLVCHLVDDKFFLIDGAGVGFTLDLKTKDIEVKKIVDTSIRKKTMFKYMVSGNSVFIITRENLSKFNERTYNNGIVYEVAFKNSSFNKAVVNEYKFNENDFLFSFVKNEEGDIGIVGGSSIKIGASDVNKYATLLNESYLSSLPVDDMNYKFIDSNNLWVRFLSSEEVVKISPESLKKELNSVHESISLNYGINIDSPKNLPMYYSSKFNLYSDVSYEDALLDIPNPSPSILYTGDGKEVATVYGDAKFFNSKKYICFMNSEKGLIGFNKKGDFKLLSDSTKAYYTDDYIIYINNGAVRYTK